MVGVSGRTTSEGTTEATFAESLDPLLHLGRYEKRVVLDESEHAVGVTAYPEYPVRVYEDENRWVYLEGRIYDHDGSLERELLTVARHALESDTDALTEWLLETDGEFVVVAADKRSGRLALLNDLLGRLPLHYHHDGDSFVFSRELRYIMNCRDVSFDSVGVAQSLLLGYTLGSRSLLRDVERLRPATLLTFDPAQDRLTTSTLHTFSFDEPAYADRSRERNATELVSRFRAACRSRAGIGDRDVVSLSGGLDSRSVLAGYHTGGLPVTAATMASEAYVPMPDVEIAGQLADIYGIDWRTYRVDSPRGGDLDTIIKTKNGQIGLLTSFIIDFFRELHDDFGPSMTYVTGDGGDKVLPDLTPAKPLADDDLIDHIVRENRFLPLEDVSEITGLSESAIEESIRSRIETYPERTPEAKYVHFLVSERAVNFLFEGEDRNRFFFWSTTPFYSLPFFRYAMNCPTDQKTRYKLYRSFLRELSPEAASQTHPDYNAAVDSPRHAATAVVDDLLSRYPGAFEVVKPLIRAINGLDTDSSLPPTTIDCIQRQIDQCDTVGDVLSADEIQRLLDAHEEYDRSEIFRVFSLTSVIDDLHSTESVLETHPETVFE
ncbi:asparagine synthetase B family protein [Natrinema salaciae]|uniref:Asparagine synthase (Glutamine-hydrolysing) n=1 Tax=Natrinema salaciae TaxID=1186196 RepID=A0A1H9A425_9EURY|nr:hypothetical protein [Natrinema salaciae]SEP71207.1 asparagine synthase (glutamine-hydrolysing) [Natrinema salaciae]